MITLNEVIDAIMIAYRPKVLSVREEGTTLSVTSDGATTKIANWKSTQLSEIVNVVGGKTLTEGYSGELLLG